MKGFREAENTASLFILFLSAVTKCPTKCRLEKKGFLSVHSVRVQPVTVRKARQQDPETAVHTVPTVRKRGEIAGSGLAVFILIQFRTPNHGTVSSTFRVGLPTLINTA